MEAEKSMSRPEEMMMMKMKMKMKKKMKIEKHERTQLLPHPQPGVQPERKTGVLGAPGMVENTSPYDQDRSSPTLQLLGAPGWWKILAHMIKIDMYSQTSQAVGMQQTPLASSRLPIGRGREHH